MLTSPIKEKNNNCETLSYQFYSKISRLQPAMKSFMIIIYNYKIISWKRIEKSVFLKNLEITNASIIVWPPAIDILSSRIHFAFTWPNNSYNFISGGQSYSGCRLMGSRKMDQSVNGIKFILIDKSQITLSYLISLWS